MSDTVVRLLHVEDEPTQHKVLMVRLKAAAGLRFDPTWVTGEDDALAAYARGRFDLVVMDYMLEQGDGLHLLKELRARDPVIPVIAVSGVAPSAVALDLIQAGADDYFDKSDLDTRRLVKSVRESLDRAAKLMHRAAAPADVGAAVGELLRDFAGRLGSEFAARVDRIEELARGADLGEADLAQLIGRAAATGDALTRPVLLELGVRLFGTPGDSCMPATAGRGDWT
jgi:DNA-binding response OmpR family regulator